MAPILDQKAYLKKYLSGPSSSDKPKKRKKKKKEKSEAKGKTRFTIIDQDVDLKTMPSHKDSEEEEVGDEVPLVAEIIDERPEHVKQQELYQSSQWKAVGDNDSKSIKREEPDDFTKRNKEASPSFSSSLKENSGRNSSSPHSSKNFDHKKEALREKQVASKVEGIKEKHSNKRHRASPKRHGDLTSDEVKSSKGRKEPKKSRFHSDSDQSPLRYNRVEKSSPYHKIKQPQSGEQSPPHSAKGHALLKGKDDIKSGISPHLGKEKDHSKLPLGHRKMHDSDSSSSGSEEGKNNKMSPQSSTKHDTDSDLSPPRTKNEKSLKKNKKSRHDSSSDHSSSPEYKHSKSGTKHSSDSDLSPPRKSETSKPFPVGRSRHDSDSEPSQQRQSDNKTSKQSRQDSDSDLSPLRKSDSKKHANTKSRHDSDSDLSPQRQKGTNEDSLSKKVSNSSYSSSLHRRKSKNKKYSSDSSPADQKPSLQHQNSGSDLSPPRKRRSSSFDSDASPPRKVKKTEQADARPSHTLSGMKAGIQDAANLRKETQAAKKREEELLRKVGDDLSGRNAETIVRDKETGQKRDLKEERRKQREVEKKQAEMDEKYMKWGKGLKQDEEQKERLEKDLYEMSKPLARYQDDPDLEQHLREQDREGDPMLEFIRKTKKKLQGKEKSKKTYEGPPAPPNRFNIMPGYRWDGVDRSNGYERRLFEKRASKISTEEEAYKWSVENM